MKDLGNNGFKYIGRLEVNDIKMKETREAAAKK